MPKTKFNYDLIVLGSGAAGSVAAEIAARAGQKVALVEATQLGGAAPHTSDIPVGALLEAAHIFDAAQHGAAMGLRTNTLGYNYPSVRTWKDLTIKRSGASSLAEHLRGRGIDLFRARAHFLSRHEISIGRRHLSAEKFLIATGSKPLIPDIPNLDKVNYLTPETAIDLLRPPKSLFVVGAGTAGVQLAELFAIFGSKVYLAETQRRILPREDDEVSAAITETFKKSRGMEILTSARVIAVKNDSLTTRVTYLAGETEHSVKVERVLFATGRTPNTDLGLENAGVEYDQSGIKTDEFLNTSTRNIWAAGDVLGRLSTTHSALYESRIATNNLLGKPKIAPNYSIVPRVIWTSPEIAAVGATEKDLTRDDAKFHRSIIQNTSVARANVANFSAGFTKILTGAKGELLGATIMAPNAAETIGQLVLAIQSGLTAQQLAETVQPFGSWGEVVRLACAKVR
ncbi:NAD(P)/FAD-dependent oxidoreductase [Candidatus Saccharibacteria bacterium]|nr:NAD(P)/FAD-dependent oxidoreductase [Candidatus Saccharibacteria bacterium]